MTTECPCCFKDTMVDGRCTRCGVQMPGGPRVPVDTVGRAKRRRRPDQDRTSAFTDLARYKEDHDESSS